MVKCPHAAQHYLTIVYRITEPRQPRALLEQAEWSAASHTHAIQERDRLLAALNDIQAQHREAFRKIERLHDELWQTCEQRDKLLVTARDIADGVIIPELMTHAGLSEVLLKWQNAARAAIAQAGDAS